ncbi:MAG: ThuA domain-containing protein [Gemmataceae bacterium]|nr:ThuA domain-containing protein [Gemmataceae bacterium]
MLKFLHFTLFLLIAVSGLAAQQSGKKQLLLLYQGPDGHPKETHEYEAGLKILTALLQKAPGLEPNMVRADEPWRDGPDLLAKADGVVIFLAEGAKWLHQDPKRLAAFGEVAKRRGGLAALHWAMGTREAKNIDGFVALFGGCHGGPDRKYKVLKTDARLPEPKHPIARGLADFSARDEFYYTLKFPKDHKIEPILQTQIDGNWETVAWAWQRPDGGRSFGFSGLHFHENWRMPEYRRLVAQGVLWTMRVEIPDKGLDVNLK